MEHGRWYPYMALETLRALPFMNDMDVQIVIADFINVPGADRRWLTPAPYHVDITIWCHDFAVSGSDFILYRGWVVSASTWHDIYRSCRHLRASGPVPAGLEDLPRF